MGDINLAPTLLGIAAILTAALTGTATLWAVIKTSRTVGTKLDANHSQNNHRLDQLLEASGAVQRALGVTEGIAQERLRGMTDDRGLMSAWTAERFEAEQLAREEQGQEPNPKSPA